MINIILYFIISLLRILFISMIISVLFVSLISQLSNLAKIEAKQKIKFQKILIMSIKPGILIFVWLLIVLLGETLYKIFN